MKLVVGPGNPGKAYARNRHNVGFQCLNYVARPDYLRLDHREDLVISQH